MLGHKTIWSRKCGLRVILIHEWWKSKHLIHKIMGSKVACATLWSSNVGNQNILIAHLWPWHHVDLRIVEITPGDPQESWDQKWPARRFSGIGYKLAKQRYWFPNKFHRVWDQKSTLSLSFIHPVILIPQCWGRNQSDPENVAFAWGSNHEIHKIMGSKVGCAALFTNRV